MGVESVYGPLTELMKHYSGVDNADSPAKFPLKTSVLTVCFSLNGTLIRSAACDVSVLSP